MLKTGRYWGWMADVWGAWEGRRCCQFDSNTLFLRTFCVVMATVAIMKIWICGNQDIWQSWFKYIVLSWNIKIIKSRNHDVWGAKESSIYREIMIYGNQYLWKIGVKTIWKSINIDKKRGGLSSLPCRFQWLYLTLRAVREREKRGAAHGKTRKKEGIEPVEGRETWTRGEEKHNDRRTECPKEKRRTTRRGERKRNERKGKKR